MLNRATVKIGKNEKSGLSGNPVTVKYSFYLRFSKLLMAMSDEHGIKVSVSACLIGNLIAYYEYLIRPKNL